MFHAWETHLRGEFSKDTTLRERNPVETTHFRAILSEDLYSLFMKNLKSARCGAGGPTSFGSSASGLQHKHNVLHCTNPPWMLPRCQPLRSQPGSNSSGWRGAPCAGISHDGGSNPWTLGKDLDLVAPTPACKLGVFGRQVVNESCSHIRVALANHPKTIRPTRPKCWHARFRNTKEAKPSHRERHCGTFSDAVWLHRIQLQKGTQASPQTCIVDRSKISIGVWVHCTKPVVRPC